jgi:hypothetical protein
MRELEVVDDDRYAQLKCRSFTFVSKNKVYVQRGYYLTLSKEQQEQLISRLEAEPALYPDDLYVEQKGIVTPSSTVNAIVQSISETLDQLDKDINRLENCIVSIDDHSSVKTKELLALPNTLRQISVSITRCEDKSSLEREINNLKTELNRYDDAMRKHDAVWRPICANIVLAATGVGLLLLMLRFVWAATIAKEPLSVNSALFFARTERERHRDTINDTLNTILTQSGAQNA